MLKLGDNILAKVSALNVYGEGEISAPGGGAVIVLVPDAPASFADVPSVTDVTQIGLQWLEPPSSGGRPIIDYRLYYDQSIDTWVELESSITSLSYTTSVALTQGRVYKFRI